MIVFRLEFEGCGPYCGELKNIDCCLYESLVSSHDGDRHPSLTKCLISDENLLDNFSLKEIYCGCSSLKSLKEWFGKFFDGIVSNGFSVVKYECPDDLCSIFEYGQVIFVKESACIVE